MKEYCFAVTFGAQLSAIESAAFTSGMISNSMANDVYMRCMHQVLEVALVSK